MSTQPVARSDQAIVLFDGECEFCRHSVRILKRLDWLGRLHFQSALDGHLPAGTAALDRRRLDELHLLTPDRTRVLAGFEAFRWMAWRLLITFPLAPLLYVPGVLWLGNKVYRWVAKNRFDLVPCKHGVCRLPLKQPIVLEPAGQ